MTIDDTQSGNGNHRLDPGENADVIIDISNTGHSDAFSLEALLSSTSSDISINSASVMFDTLAFGITKLAIFNITVNEEVAIGTPVDFNFSATALPYAISKDFAVQVGLVVEDFETGDFTSYPWIQSGTQPWVVTTAPAYEGLYSARSGIITDSQTSELSINVTVLSADSVSFFRKVSCEDDPYGKWLHSFDRFDLKTSYETHCI